MAPQTNTTNFHVNICLKEPLSSISSEILEPKTQSIDVRDRIVKTGACPSLLVALKLPNYLWKQQGAQPSQVLQRPVVVPLDF
jgi:hypothetical protein